MSHTITDPANPDYSFGQAFDYSVWPKNTTIDLCNVPWNNDYRDVVRFANQTALDTYIDSLNPLSRTINSISYLRPNEPIGINLPHNVAQQYNYVRVKNPAQPVPGQDFIKNFYYFILETKYVAANHTQLVLQLDIWSTYNFALNLGNCYVERGHVSIANSNQFDNYGRDYLTVPEGLDTGSDYIVGWEKFDSIIDWSNSTTFPGLDFPNYSVLVYSTVDLEASSGTVTAPVLVSAAGGGVQGIISGAAAYIWKEFGGFSLWLTANQDKPWMTQGIMSVTLVPDLDRYYSGIPWPTDATAPLNAIPSIVTKASDFIHTMQSDWRNSTIFDVWPTKYKKLAKFFTSPYMVIEMTTYTGTPVVIRPELWNDPDATVIEKVGLAATAQKLTVYPKGYNAYVTGVSYRDVGEFLDVASQISNFPQLPAVNNSGIAFLAANKNQIAFSYQNADWSQQRALQGAQTAYDINKSQLQTNLAQTGLANANLQGQTGISNANMLNQQLPATIADTLGGGAGGGLAGVRGAGLGAASGIIGGAANAFMAGMNADAASQSANLQTHVNTAQTAIGNRQASFANDSNLSLAQFVARGDYANEVAGINAKLQDTKMLQPTTSGQVGGDAFNISNDTFGVALKWKWIDMAHMAMIGDFWLRYGYAVNRFMQFPGFMVMDKFTYWKLKETYITGANIPEGFKQAFRGMFEKGITVWANPADIGNIDISANNPLPGVSY